MITRRISVLADNIVIGTSDVRVVDSGMAVAGGQFAPTCDYVPELHATELEGIDRSTENGRTLLCAVTADGVELLCRTIALIDWAETAGEQFGREVTLFGIDVGRF